MAPCTVNVARKKNLRIDIPRYIINVIIITSLKLVPPQWVEKWRRNLTPHRLEFFCAELAALRCRARTQLQGIIRVCSGRAIQRMSVLNHLYPCNLKTRTTIIKSIIVSTMHYFMNLECWHVFLLGHSWREVQLNLRQEISCSPSWCSSWQSSKIFSESHEILIQLFS